LEVQQEETSKKRVSLYPENLICDMCATARLWE